MVEYTKVDISTNLKDELQKLATDKNTDIDNIIKLLMVENEEIKTKPANYLADTKVSTKDNKNKKGEVTSQTYSTVIPKPIVSKLGLETQQLLYWDIDEYKIVITPEVNPVPTPEEASIQAGTEIFNDMLFNGKTDIYKTPLNSITQVLSDKEPNVKTNEEKVNFLVNKYKTVYSDKRNGIVKDNQRGFKQVVLYLLDYSLNLPDQYEILREVYNEIIKTD